MFGAKIGLPERRAELRRQLTEIQMELAMMGEFYPVVVRHHNDLRSISGAPWPLDTTRPIMTLDDRIIIPIVGGAWSWLPQDE